MMVFNTQGGSLDWMKARAISLPQPEASLVAFGAKRIATRAVSSPHRGLTLIHASSRTNKRLLMLPEVQELLGDGELPKGAILAVCELTYVCPTEALRRSVPGHLLTPLELILDDFRPGRYAYYFDEVKELSQSVPCTGKSSLWRPNRDVLGRLMQLTDHHAT